MCEKKAAVSIYILVWALCREPLLLLYSNNNIYRIVSSKNGQAFSGRGGGGGVGATG